MFEWVSLPFLWGRQSSTNTHRCTAKKIRINEYLSNCLKWNQKKVREEEKKPLSVNAEQCECERSNIFIRVCGLQIEQQRTRNQLARHSSYDFGGKQLMYLKSHFTINTFFRSIFFTFFHTQSHKWEIS